MSRYEKFSSRWSIIILGLGMAVGTGNIWRFPRIAAENGGGAFLIPWLFFLVTWSLPLLVAEFGLGRGARRAPIGAFSKLLGPSYAWMGGFIAVTTTMIMFYYSVVTGWTLKYFLLSVSGMPADSQTYWTTYTASGWQPILFHLVSLCIVVAVVSRGIVRGIERATRCLIPLLFVLLLMGVARAVTLEGADRGLRFLFQPDLAALLNYRTWLEALTQSAWSTGAGWGLILTYGMHVRRKENVFASSLAIGLGNNLASLLAGMAILPTAFAVLSEPRALEIMGTGNTGLTFIWIPELFTRVSGGSIALPFFFLALFAAALSSLIAMVELGTRILMDTGLSRSVSVRIVGGVGLVFGIPSAASLGIFDNQDWVWSLGLMISGLFIARAVTQYGSRRFYREYLGNKKGDLRAEQLFEWAISVLIPVQFLVMFSWWMYQSVAVYDSAGWWNPFRVYSLGTCLVQWAFVLGLLRFFNRRLAVSSLRSVN